MALNLRRSGPWIGIGGLVVALWFYVAAGLVAPTWGVGLLLLAWFGMLVLSVRWFHRRPYVVLAMPLVAAALWLAVLAVGGAWLGWTA